MSGRLTGVLVNVGDVLSEAQVSVSIWFVLDEPEQIETGEESGWQLDVLLDALPGIVAAVGRVGCGENGTTGVEGGHDSSLERKTTKTAQATLLNLSGSFVLPVGLVAAHTLAMEMVCCSITSWMAVRSASAILSNSSIQQTPRSARTKAPPSKVISPVRGSRITAAVKPTPEDPRPVVY